LCGTVSMAKRDARKLSPEVQHELRVRAVKAHLAGRTYELIGEHLEVSTTFVGKAVNLYREGGWEGLEPLKRGRPEGSCRRLSPSEEREIQKLITDKTPDQLKMPFVLWTRPAVAQLVSERFGTKLPVRTLGDYLRKWGFTPQKPQKRALERDDAAIRAWLEIEYPALRRRAVKEGAEILWEDETGVSNQDNRGHGFAPKGKTPTVRGMAKRATVSMASAISNGGTLRFMVYKGAINAGVFLGFLKRLVKSTDRKIFLIADNLPAHKAIKVRQWIEANSERLELFLLPPYAPELNPDEYLNQVLKSRMAQQAKTDSVSALKRQVRSVMQSIRRTKGLVESFFLKDEIYFAAL